METPSFANLPSSFVLLKAAIPVHSNTIYKWVLKPFLWTMWINDNDNDIANLTENPICLRQFLQNKHNIENKRRRCSIFGSWLYDKIWIIYFISQPLHVNYWWTGHTNSLSLSLFLSLICWSDIINCSGFSLMSTEWHLFGSHLPLLVPRGPV